MDLRTPPQLLVELLLGQADILIKVSSFIKKGMGNTKIPISFPWAWVIPLLLSVIMATFDIDLSVPLLG